MTRRTLVPLVIALLAGGAGGWYLAGEDAMHQAEVSCLSLTTSISCGPVNDPGQAEFSVPVDVAWTGKGGFHEGGRPACLPVDGTGAAEPVTVTWTEVEVDGRSWKQVVGVAC